MIKLKRVYEEPSQDDGFRVLVEGLWPRGMSKENAHINLWLRDVAPSTGLRRWYRHDPSRWEEFRRRYWDELREKEKFLDVLREKSQQGLVTFVFASRDVPHSGALALKEYLEKVAAKTQ